MLKKHLIVRTFDLPGQHYTCITACGREGFKSLRTANVAGEWQAQQRLGGLLAVWAREFEPNAQACARCTLVWTEGGGIG